MCAPYDISSTPLKQRRIAADIRVEVTNPPDIRSGQDGFTLIEVLVAAMILMAGMIATFAMLDTANGTLSNNNARIGASNLARELTEYARSSDYDKLTPSQVGPALQAHPTIGGSGNPFVVNRRGVAYSVTASACVFDDPKDGLSPEPAPNACTPAAAPIAGTAQEVNPDDFRRVRFDVAWTRNGHTSHLTQTALIVNPAGGLGPRIISLTDPSASGQTTSGSSLAFTATSTQAQTVRWLVDDALGSSGDITGPGKTWNFTWSFGTFGSGDFDHDGVYLVTAQAFDSRGVPGDTKVSSVLLNRAAPIQPSGFDGGFNDAFGVVDLRWARNPERDIVRYRVYRGPTGSELVCDVPVDRIYCTDTGASRDETIYRLVAVDKVDLGNPSTGPANLREGAQAVKVITPSSVTGDAPPAPINLQATLSDNLPYLSWEQPPNPAGKEILFFRVYRDTGTGLANRYDTTPDDEPSYSDPDPGASTQHKYWITAVDSDFNESAPSAHVISPPFTP
jgi:prepilin-type N-terminal cleavage/methylation domain-containing protein